MSPAFLALASQAVFLALVVAVPGQGYVFYGPTPTAALGTSVSSAGDVNDDGYDDVVIGTQAGLAYVYSGKDGSALHTFTSSYYPFPSPLTAAGVGDGNGDGFDDVAVVDAYVVVVHSGKDGSVLHTYTQSAASPAVNCAGDVNADGYDDVILGPGTWAFGGAVEVRSGKDGSILHTWSGAPSFGHSVAGAGDVNADGFDDVVIGEPGYSSEAGRVEVRSGRNGSLLHQFIGSAGTRFGEAVDGAGDLNGDAYSDIIVGAPLKFSLQASQFGRAVALSGKTGAVLFTVYGDSGDDKFGSAVTGAGDVDGNGVVEVMVGAPQPPLGSLLFPIGPGYARVFSASGALMRQLTGNVINDQFGASVSGSGDINGDGLADLVVGAPDSDAAGANAGMAVVQQSTSGHDPGRFTNYGAGCPGSNARLPRIGIAGRPVLGKNYDMTLRAAPASALGLLRVAIGRNNVGLAFIQMPGCTLLTQFYADVVIGTDTDGRAKLTLPVPNLTSLVGVKVDFQWSIRDIAANPLGFVMSDGGEISIGRG